MKQIDDLLFFKKPYLLLAVLLLFLLVPGCGGLKFKNDNDKDGITNSEDHCPDVAGIKEMNGCPDTDADGIADAEDHCPDLAGTIEMNGCPDKDNDGVPDDEDKCPDVPGAKENDGCPLADTDGDNVPDKEDQCPDAPGSRENNGCPVETQSGYVPYDNNLFFQGNRTQLDQRTLDKLKNIANVLKDNPEATIVIKGIPNGAGSDQINLALAQQRANGVKAFLAEEGIDRSRLLILGQGESLPVPDENTSAQGVSLVITGINGVSNFKKLKPPKPTSVEPVDFSLFNGCSTLESVRQKIVGALNKGGYREIRYYSLEDGFAIVTQIEQTNATWKPLAGPDRWIVGPNAAADPSKGFWYNLLNERKGRYRCIIFAIHKTIGVDYDETLNATTILTQSYLSSPYQYIPDALKQTNSLNYKVDALIYQFVKPENNTVATLSISSPNPGENLAASNILKYLKE